MYLRKDMQYIEVILPLRLGWRPSYSCECDIAPGQRVQVRFAGRKYVGVVSRTGITPDVAASRIQPILERVDGLAPVTAEELEFWEFLSSYYLCTIGEVYKAAYPALKVNSEKIAANALSRAEASRERTRAAALALASSRVNRLKERLEKKEQAILARKAGTKGRAALESEREKILSELSAASEALAALEDESAGTAEKPAVHPEEKNSSRSRTSAGKPVVYIGNDPEDLYIQHVRNALEEGRQVLVLAPEIAALKALESTLSPIFPEDIKVFHSAVTPAGRRKVAEALRKGGKGIVLGTRSALFLPFNGLGLVIIHEEQDTWYKQTEPAPRYHGRDAAVMLAGIHGAQVILGSCCPSFETTLNIQSGKYTLQSGSADPCPASGPIIIDTGAERRKNGMLGSLSRVLIREAADVSGPIILVRAWEKEEEVRQQAVSLLPGKDIRIMTLNELKREGAGGAEMIAVLQADALVSKDDFRADERAMQLLSQLQALAPRVLVQTAVADRFNRSRTLAELMKERKDFNYPPYSRMMDVNITDSNTARLALMVSRLSDVLDSSAVQMADGSYKLRFTFLRNEKLAGRKKDIMEKVGAFETSQRYGGHITIDVDPQ